MWELLEVDQSTLPALLGPRSRVLLVERDAPLRSEIASRLLREGFDVYQAASGEEALDVLSSLAGERDLAEVVDLLVFDVSRGDRSAVAVVRGLRASGCELPVLFLSAFQDREVLTSASELSAFVLATPFSLDRLAETALEVIQGVHADAPLS